MRSETQPTLRLMSVISVFRLEVDENCAILGYYAVSSGNSLPTFRDSFSVPSSGGILDPWNGTDRLSHIFDKELELFAA